MRSLLFVVVLAGCGGAAAQGPAWPQPPLTVDDGGESIAPRNTTLAAIADKPSPVATAVADDDERTPAIEPTDPKTPPAAAGEIPDAADDTSSDDTVIIHDEIVIEIDDE
jgi:hypothetical protein